MNRGNSNWDHVVGDLLTVVDQMCHLYACVVVDQM